MNLVIDDAIEVKQPTKLDPEETRRSLGMLAIIGCIQDAALILRRPDPPQGR